MITRITTTDYTTSQVLTVDADKESIAKVLAFIAELNKQQQTTAKISGPPSIDNPHI